MFGLSRPVIRCGLQILDRQIKLAASVGASSSRIAHYERIPLVEGIVREGRILDEDQLAQQLAGAVDKLGLRDRQATLTIPTASIVLRKGTFPKVKPRELRNLIDVELHGGSTQLPFKKPVFDFVPIRQTGSEQEVLIFASPTEVVEQYAKIVKWAGLRPAAVDSTPLALYRLLARAMKAGGPVPSGRFMILDAEHDRAEISIFENGCPVFFRTLLISVHSLLDHEEDRKAAYGRQLAVELERVLKYVKYSVASAPEEIEELLLVGDADLTDSLAKTLGTDFGRIVPLPVDAAIANYNSEMKSFAVPIGLAMKGA